jgi:hypothetical protein
MPGSNDRIHGYSPIYRNPGHNPNPQRLHSFDLQINGNPGAFINRLVNTPPGFPATLDHQGHIVPQNILNQELTLALNAMAIFCVNEHANSAGVQAFINTNGIGFPWLRDVFSYGQQIGAPMFDFEVDDIEDRFDGFFSIVTWNPINLCRAPSDDRRNGRPGNTIDIEVSNFIDANQQAQGVDAAWVLTLNQLIANTNFQNIKNYITACSQTLDWQLHNGVGYYTFDWALAPDGRLIPQ